MAKLSAVSDVKALIEAALRPLADPHQAAPMRAYMLDQFAFLGIRANARREALRDVYRVTEASGINPWTATSLLQLSKVLWDLPEREFQYVAVDLLAKHHWRLDLDSLPGLLKLVKRASWWDTVDGLAGVVGDVLLRCRAEQPDAQSHMDAWVTDSNLWVRRIAILHQLGWKAQTDEKRLLRYALTLAPEKEFFIRKAIGWALRDYAKAQPQTVRNFLHLYANSLSGLTRREAGKHLN